MTLAHFQRLLEGAWVTVQVTALAVLIGTASAIILGVASRSPIAILRSVVRVYVEVFRGVSALILLFWTFYALPLIGLDLTPLQAGILALSVNLSAYGTEIVRGAIGSIPKGQTEASIAVHLSPTQRLRHIILPQAVVTMLPPYGNLVIEVLKASALVSLITLSDLLKQAQNLRLNRSAPSVEIFVVVLLLYFAIALAITGVVRLLEQRFGRGLDVGSGARMAAK